MALNKPIEHQNGIVTTYSKITKITIHYYGEGRIQVTTSEYLNESIRQREKAGEMVHAFGERQYYLPLGNKNVNLAVLYARLKKETTELAGAEDVLDTPEQIAEAKATK